jgi:hypothetical protein
MQARFYFISGSLSGEDVGVCTSSGVGTGTGSGCVRGRAGTTTGRPDVVITGATVGADTGTGV